MGLRSEPTGLLPFVLSLSKEDALVFHVETPCKFLLMGEQVDTLHPGLYSKLTGYLGVFF